jgi:hypothetical protein
MKRIVGISETIVIVYSEVLFTETAVNVQQHINRQRPRVDQPPSSRTILQIWIHQNHHHQSHQKHDVHDYPNAQRHLLEDEQCHCGGVPELTVANPGQWKGDGRKVVEGEED